MILKQVWIFHDLLTSYIEVILSSFALWKIQRTIKTLTYANKMKNNHIKLLEVNYSNLLNEQTNVFQWWYSLVFQPQPKKLFHALAEGWILSAPVWTVVTSRRSARCPAIESQIRNCPWSTLTPLRAVSHEMNSQTAGLHSIGGHTYVCCLGISLWSVCFNELMCRVEVIRGT